MELLNITKCPILKLFILSLLFNNTYQNARNKRQIQPELPRIMTQNGHLVFQTGTNHNISFRATSGGYVNVNGEDLAVIVQSVKANKLAIDQMRTAPTVAPSTESRLSQLEARIRNIQPTAELLNQLNNAVSSQIPTNLNARLMTVETSLANLQPTGQVQTMLDSVTSSVASLTRQMRGVNRLVRSLRQTRRKVTQLEENVQQLQTLLTTNECTSNPCRNGGTCIDSYGSFFCRCPSNFQGSTCDEDINECAIYAGTDLGCQNGATCTNTHGGYTCQCTPNYHGVRCTETHEDCTGASSMELCGHGTCVNIPRAQGGQARYRCICDQGWTTGGGSDPACTVDVDECTGARHPCSQNPLVPCINMPGSFQCGSCPAGYSGNGFTCVDINECAHNNGGCSLAPRVECINTQGSYQCGPCPSGFQGDGRSCTWVGMCNQDNGGCHHQAACTESPGFQGRVCTCPPGYVGNGIGATGCVVQGPTTGPCGSTPCQNGAACQALGTGYRCVCQPGYTGTNCETNINECASSPCQNGGSCSDQVNGYACQCTEAYTGANCEVEQQSCGSYLSGESGTFRYPQDPGSQYPHQVSCAWIITTSLDKILIVTFPTFEIEAHPQCNYDFLQINDGNSAASHAIGRYCGTTPPNNGQPINSTHHQLYFWFYSDASESGNGFTVQWRSAYPVCGGNLAGADHGAISSPGYPGNYPHNRDCVWTVTVSPGKKILFSFATLAIETHPNCDYDYLEIRDGGLDTSPVLRRFCNQTSPAPLSTTGPTAWLKFHTDESQTDRGFHITYAAIEADRGCGASFNSSSGVLISPNYPNPYNHDASCVWIVTVQQGERIMLTFTNMDLEGTASCSYDFVEVRDGPGESSPLIGRYCGDFIPGILTTTGNVLYVKFRSDDSVTAAGFRATWKIACGGTFTAPNGTIHSPNYPNPYPGNRECDYYITVATGNRVLLTFNAFDVEGREGSNDCPYDYVEVRDGGSVSSRLMGHFCGDQIPPPKSSTLNEMFVRFVTDGSIQNLGFEATYQAFDAGCWGRLTGPSGHFQSPGYPNQYPHGVNCTWNIEVEPGQVIRLFFNTFSMESHPHCQYDSVSVYDNYTSVATSLLGSYCGRHYPPIHTSTSNVMTIQLISDASIAHEGFSASYWSFNASAACGREYTENVGVITSLNWPNRYPHQRQCIWTINVAQGNQIVLNITDFELQYEASCNSDFLEIRNGGFPSSPLVGRFCGTTIDRVIVSHSNRMYLKMVTDRFVNNFGFRIVYDATSTGCGADFTSPTGSFVSPNYPHPYGHNAECFYTIMTSRGSTITLTFADIDLELQRICAYDYIEVREGNAAGTLLGRFCGNTIPDPVVSRSNVMWIKYRTDYSVSGRGFHATYISSCNNRLKDYSGVIESPNFPQPYQQNMNCSWIIETTLGNSLNISFSHFDIDRYSNCAYHFLELRNGDNANAPLLGKYCGSSLPPYTVTSDRFAFVNFVSHGYGVTNGFRLEYVTDGCGGYFTSPTGTFTSPGYPNPYPHRRICEWTIVAPTGSYIQLNIQNFDLESHSNCSFDVLEIYGGGDDQAPTLHRLCHTQSSPMNLSTTGNMMFVRFKSDISISGRGFNATYKTAVGGCGGNITAPSGTILSKNYPDNYPHNTDCVWLITVAQGRSVALTFTDFDVESHSMCRYDYVAVYDGDSSQSPLLVKHCGDSLPSPVTYTTNGNRMYIHMRTDSSLSMRGFKAEYVTGCGGTVSAETNGELTSPNYPTTYPRMSNCTWVLVTNHSSDRITIFFTHMNLEESPSCAKDYLLVRDGNDDGAPLIGQYCGNESPSSITSQGSALQIQFVSDSYNGGSGFRVAYTKSTSACGGNFESMSGSFNSPGYPNNYPLDTECVWTISVSPGSRVQISFSFFNLEDHDTCNTDYIEIHEGQLGGPLLGRFCGNQPPTNLTAYNGLWVKFRSDESGTGQGFQATYSSMFGGELSGTSGQIASPHYPHQYPHRVDYIWTVTVPIGMIVRVTFNALDMERSNRGCVYDYLKLRDGGTSDSLELGSYCGSTVPEPLLTTGNQLQVEFHTDWSGSGQGFLLSWDATSDRPITTLPPTAGVPGCSGTLIGRSEMQTLESPGYPYGYQNNLDCGWSFIAIPGYRLWFNISDINLEAHSACRWDTLNIYDGASANSDRLGLFCGRTPNAELLLTRTNQGFVAFKTDGSVNKTGFSLQYKSVCGGEMMGPVAVITSDNYTSSYPLNSNCTWIFTVLPGRTVRASFSRNFSIQGSPAYCGQDYIMLLNGGSPTSPPLGSGDGRYCGNAAPPTMESSSNMVYIQFLSDGYGSALGFSLTLTEVQLSCGGHLQLNTMVTSGIITSPNYPENYPQNVDCVWTITGPPNERIQIDFLETFSIERHSDCNFDFLELRDGGTIISPVLAKLCGYILPNTTLSTGNVLYARFRTDNSRQHIGFKAQYKIATCGGRYVGSSGTITSPNYPNVYDNNMDCEWTVQAPAGHFMTFTFTEFSTERSSNCSSADYVEIRDFNSTGPVLRQVCGNMLPSPIRTPDSYAYIRFHSNNGRQFTGFRLNFEASIEECGGDLTGPTGTIQSPNFPGNYPHSRTCQWKITVPAGRRITFQFTALNLETHPRCHYDFVSIRNGFFRESPFLGRFCNVNPGVIETSGNTAFVWFRADASVTNGGFQLTYTSNNEQVCGGELTTSPGNITSPGYDGISNYADKLSCIWTLHNPRFMNSSIRIQINALDIQDLGRCYFSKLLIKEGDYNSGTTIGKLCGNNSSPALIVAPVPEVWLSFTSSRQTEGTGFHLSYSFTQCGGILTALSGVISSPNFPGDYDHMAACAWLIQAPEGAQIQVTVTDFTLEAESNCIHDYLEIFNGPYSSSPSIGRFCGTNKPNPFVSQSNAVRIIFVTDINGAAPGFRMTYSVRTQGCGGLYHSNSGNLSSPNYPRSYPHNTECQWDINVEEGYTLTLTFQPPFDLQHHGSCDDDYVEVRGGLSNGTRGVMGRWCENILPPPQTSSDHQLVVKFRSDANTNGNGFAASWQAGCGGIITTPSGILISPGYRNKYGHRLRCNYTLNMDPQHYIVLNFLDFDLEAHNRCAWDFVAVYAGNSTNGRFLGRFCGQIPPGPLSALGPMFIQFYTDGSVAHKGFRAQYFTRECGGVYTHEVGEISTPTHSHTAYDNNMNCTWSITVAQNRVIDFKFTAINIESHQDCRYDSVSLYDGPSTSSPLIGQFCGNVLPTGLIRSTGNSMLINFITDFSVTRDGFKGVYFQTYGEAQGCGGILRASSGSISSVDSNRDGMYEDNLFCPWTIFAEDNNVIRLTITRLDIENHADCAYDSLIVYDGMNTHDSLVGRYCGTTAPPQFVSTSNKLHIIFQSDSSTTGFGFNATYTQEPAVCGGMFNSTEEPITITSPGYPNSFPQDVRCRWTIAAPNSMDRVHVVVSSINMQATPICQPDYLEFRDYPMGDQGRAVHTCGRVPPPLFDSFASTIQINYASTGGMGTGFSLTFTTADCNRNYTASSGQIFSPWWPMVYPHLADCLILVMAPEGTTVSLYFNAFQIESHRSCRFDYLQVLNGTDPPTSDDRKMCGNALPDPIFSDSNVVGLKFVTDHSVQRSGFDITYTATTQGVGCGGTITGISGSFTSPGYPGNYTQVSTCRWLIQAPPRRFLNLTFTNLLVTNSLNCATDYVMVYNGNSDSGEPVVRHCGGETVAPLLLTGNVATVKYVSSGSGVNLAFRLTYTS